MTNVRATTHKAVLDNDLSSVVFVDPFGTVTRQAKRNVIVASFIALLIAVLELEITGFLGLQASNSSLGNALAQGLACLVVAYFLISLIFHVFVDYSAWQFQRERVMTKPYLDLVALLEAQVNVTGEQVKNACASLNGIVIENDMRSQLEAGKHISSALGQLTSINERLAGLVDEMRPLIDAWASAIRRMKRLDARLRLRILSLWCLDIIFPIAFALLALWGTHDGVVSVIERIVG